MNYCYLNGKIVAEDQAGVSLWDIGLLRGYGVFDGLRTFDGKIFHFPDHWQRLERSARKLGLRTPISQSEGLHVLHDLLRKNGLNSSDATIRIILTGGKSPDGMHYNAKTPTFFMLVQKMDPFPEDLYKRGATLMPYEFNRIMPDTKYLDYLTAVMLQPELEASRSLEPLYTWQGNILEAATSNFFVFHGNRLITAKDGIIFGITRKVVLALARKLKFSIEQRPVKLTELKTATEAFLCSSYKDVMPVTRVGKQVIGTGKPGPNTQALINAFEKYGRSGSYTLK